MSPAASRPSRPSADGAPDPEADAGLGRTHAQLARSRVRAAVVLGIEALGLLGAATFAAVDLQGDPGAPANYGITIAAFLVVFAVLLGLAARSLLRAGRFGVGYGVTWQLFQALVGATMIRGGLLLPGAFALLTAIIAFVLLIGIARYTPTPLEED